MNLNPNAAPDFYNLLYEAIKENLQHQWPHKLNNEEILIASTKLTGQFLSKVRHLVFINEIVVGYSDKEVLVFIEYYSAEKIGLQNCVEYCSTEL